MKVVWEGSWEPGFDGLEKAKIFVVKNSDGFFPAIKSSSCKSRTPTVSWNLAKSSLQDAKNSAVDLFDQWFWTGRPLEKFGITNLFN